MKAAPRPKRPRSASSTDDRTIYVGAFLQHRNTAELVVSELMKDFDGSNTDCFAVTFDTFHDRRSGYQFGVNPAGAAGTRRSSTRDVSAT